MLQALWLLSAQRGIADNRLTAPQARSKKKAKRVASGRAPAPEAVRIITLRSQQPSGSYAAAPSGRIYRHRWTVSGHWRNQAIGKKWSERRPIYINPYLKGPQDKPLLTGDKVKAWTR